MRATRTNTGNVNQQSAERSVLYHLIQTPTLISEFCAEVTLNALTGRTIAAVCLIAEYPSLCAEVGALAVAEYVGVEEDLVDLILGLTHLPDWAVLTLPPWSVALNYLAGSLIVARVGALEQWRSEVSRGVDGQRLDSPATWRFDSLWKAACYEAGALESQRMGLVRVAVELMEQAVSELAKNPATPERAA